MAPSAVVGRRNMLHPIGMCAELIALKEAAPGWVLWVVNRDRMPTVLLHDRETWDIGGTIAHVDHVFEGNRTQLGRHVIVHIIIMSEHSLVDPEEVLRLRRVRNRTFWKADPAFQVFSKLAAEHGGHVTCEAASFKQRL